MTTLSKFNKLVFTTGVADFMRHKNRCPLYWRKKPEESLWKQGYNHARRLAR